MKIEVIAHPRSSQKKIVFDGNLCHVYVHAVPENGRANREIIGLLAEHFQVAKSRVTLLSGETGKKKIFEVQS